MTTSENHDAGRDGPATVPQIVDRDTWQAARDELLLREKAHTREGLEATMPALALLDMTARGRVEAWQDYPEGWPEGKPGGWFWRSHEDGFGNNWTGGRPTIQWTRPGATPVEDHH